MQSQVTSADSVARIFSSCKSASFRRGKRHVTTRCGPDEGLQLPSWPQPSFRRNLPFPQRLRKAVLQVGGFAVSEFEIIVAISTAAYVEQRSRQLLTRSQYSRTAKRRALPGAELFPNLTPQIFAGTRGKECSTDSVYSTDEHREHQGIRLVRAECRSMAVSGWTEWRLFPA